MNTVAEKILKQLTELCESVGAGQPTINYSTTSKQFYLSTPIEVKDGICLKSDPCHENTIEAACLSYLQSITGKLLVFNASNENRKEVFFTDLTLLGRNYESPFEKGRIE